MRFKLTLDEWLHAVRNAVALWVIWFIFLLFEDPPHWFRVMIYSVNTFASATVFASGIYSWVKASHDRHQS